MKTVFQELNICYQFFSSLFFIKRYRKISVLPQFLSFFHQNKFNFVTLNRLNKHWNKLTKRHQQIINKNNLHYPRDSLKINAVGTFVNVHDTFSKSLTVLIKNCFSRILPVAFRFNFTCEAAIFNLSLFSFFLSSKKVSLITLTVAWPIDLINR